LSGHFAPIPQFCPSCGGISPSVGRGERILGLK